MLPTAMASIGQAFREIKRFSVYAWEGEYHTAAGVALKEIIELSIGQCANDKPFNALGERASA